MMTTTPQLGQWFTICATVRKTGMNGKHHRSWLRYAYKPVRAMYVGKRQVYDGTVHYEYDDGNGYWTTFERTATHTVYLFVLDGKRNPVYVLPEDATL